MTREEAIKELEILKEDYWDDDGYGHKTKQYDNTMLALDMAIKALEQEPQTFKWCTDCREYDQEKHCCHRWSKVIRNTVEEMKQEYIERDVLDKIRAEIETKYGQCDICEYFEDYDYEENDISEYRPIGNIADILQILDKYKAESENT